MDILIKCNKYNITSIVNTKYKKKYFKTYKKKYFKTYKKKYFKTFEEDFSVFISH